MTKTSGITENQLHSLFNPAEVCASFYPRNMSYTFDWLSKDVVKKLQGRDLRPVKCLSDATKFCLFNILQETSSRLALKTEYIPVGFTLLHLLEPNIPVPGMVSQGTE
jgi:hypothetical protein